MSSSREKPKFETLWTVRSQAGEPTSVICVRNLQATSCIVGTDAWGRQLKYQPLVISAEASLSQPFASSSAEDAVGEDTIHYGHMSKCILDALRYIAEKGTGTTSVGDAVDIICDSLTGMRVDGGEGFVPWDKKQRPLLKPQSLASLSVTISLPKATRCGEGISLTGMSLFNERKVVMYGRCLRLHRLRVPTLIGVNEHERKARQTVVADVEIERYDTWPQGGGFNSVEDAIESVSILSVGSVPLPLLCSPFAVIRIGSDSQALTINHPELDNGHFNLRHT